MTCLSPPWEVVPRVNRFWSLSEALQHPDQVSRLRSLWELQHRDGGACPARGIAADASWGAECSGCAFGGVLLGGNLHYLQILSALLCLIFMNKILLEGSIIVPAKTHLILKMFSVAVMWKVNSVTEVSWTLEWHEMWSLVRMSLPALWLCFTRPCPRAWSRWLCSQCGGRRPAYRMVWAAWVLVRFWEPCRPRSRPLKGGSGEHRKEQRRCYIREAPRGRAFLDTSGLPVPR